jgi:hypothetical protein
MGVQALPLNLPVIREALGEIEEEELIQIEYKI